MRAFYQKYLSASIIQHLLNTVFFPYFVIILMSKRLSLELWGELLFIQGLSSLFLIFLNMGIEFHGTRAIASNKEDHKLVGGYNFVKIINSIIILSLGLLLIIFGVISSNLFYLSLLLSISISLNPSWVFLAKKNIQPMLYIDIFYKILFISFIYYFIRDDDLGAYYIYFLSSNNFLIVISGLIYLKYKYSFQPLNLTNYLITVKDLSSLFLYQISGIAPLMLPVIFLGFMSDFRSVAIFGNADKLFKGLRSIFSPITRIAITLFSSNFKNEKLIKKISLCIAVAGCLLVLIIIPISSDLIIFLLGEKYQESIIIFQILILAVPFIWTYNFIIGAHFIPKKFELYVTKFNLIITIISLIIMPFLIYRLSVFELSWYIVIIEISMFIILSLKMLSYFRVLKNQNVK